MSNMELIPGVGYVTKKYEEVILYADPRTRQWLLLEGTPVYVWALTVAYLVFVWQGLKFMRNRPAFNIPVWFIVVYNLGLVLLSCYMLVEILLSVYQLKYNWLCAVYNADTHKNPQELRIANVLWWYFFSKAIEFFDTVLMVLRKKESQVTFLHVFHHVSVFNIWWFVMTFVPGGCAFFSSSINCFVHIVMYSYYGLSAIPQLKGKLWWKRYITKLQLLQLAMTLVHTLQTYRTECDFPDWGKHMLASYMFMLLALFANFYIHAYLMKPSNKKKDEINGHVNSNGHMNGHLKENGENGVYSHRSETVTRITQRHIQTNN